MYSQPIATTVDVMGLIVYLTYFVDENHSVNWYLDDDYYDEESHSSELKELSEHMLRTHWSGYIRGRLFEEFQSRQYAEEASFAAKLEEQDVF